MNSNDKPILLLSIVFFLGAVAVFFYLISPLYSGSEGFLDKEKIYNAKKDEFNNLKNYHATIITNYKDLEKAGWEKIEEGININFSSNDPMFLPKMYDFFRQRCIAAGMHLDSINGSVNWDLKKENVPAEDAADRIKKNPFNLGLSGSYASFKNLLTDLETQALLTSLEEISFSSQALVSSSKGKAVSGSMPFSLKLSIPSY